VTTTDRASGESARLRAKLELALPMLVAASRQFLDHPRITELYPAYLRTSHWIIRASVPLMETALERAQAMAAEDPAAAGLAEYLDHHVDEELGHDEWLLEDLEALGEARADVLAEPPSAAVASLVGAPYYWILHYHPVAVLGYIALLEGYPPTIAEVDLLMKRTGYGRDAFRTLIRHAELDPLHRDDLDQAIDRLPLAPEHTAVMGACGLHTVEAFTRVLGELVEGADEPG
jgi:Iron-containing redox enzyme